MRDRRVQIPEPGNSFIGIAPSRSSGIQPVETCSQPMNATNAD